LLYKKKKKVKRQQDANEYLPKDDKEHHQFSQHLNLKIKNGLY
jgi:hypothetical protein